MSSTTKSPSQAQGATSAMNRELKLQIHDLMIKARTTEETLIQMSQGGEGFFWIGAPGEEAFSVPLGLLTKKGEGPDFDYLHLHYRGSPTVLAMGADPLDTIRQMHSTITDPYSAGRNFVNHYAIHKWNIVPVTPTIETQYATCIGTAWVQRRHGGDGISIVTGGDAGTAEGDFATCLNWSTRPGFELPILIIITHNKFGISTPAGQVQSSLNLHERATPYGIRNRAIDGNDPVVAYEALVEAMDYIRKERKPFCLQANVSRLNGHSSSSGAKRVTDERDCIADFEAALIADGIATRADCDAVWEKWRTYTAQCRKQALSEPLAGPETVFKNIFKES